MPLSAKTANDLIATLSRIADREDELDLKDNSSYFPEERQEWRTILKQAMKEHRLFEP